LGQCNGKLQKGQKVSAPHLKKEVGKLGN